ncbi:hypothetical protein Pcinc_043648 [Petrolisthes cinctipes]|uniref:Uncharacterized protein n=1 Tax=Petrolisthes cinctipes TaxID=88211 RepID=A0AAE1BF98_PETCI|nr:hypothetical protein Pcinc_043648 [Petrolisthes cinctipes]
MPWTHLAGFELKAETRFLPKNAIGKNCHVGGNQRWQQQRVGGSNSLTITDGSGSDSTQMAHYCGDTKPRTCHRARRLLHETDIRPCDNTESYVSSGTSSWTVVRRGSGLVTPVHVLSGAGKVSPGGNISFSAPRDIFLYGRGGRQAVQCSWHLMGLPDQVVRLTITAISTGTSGCQTEVNHQTKALRCVRGGASHMALSISEWPWAGVELPLGLYVFP